MDDFFLTNKSKLQIICVDQKGWIWQKIHFGWQEMPIANMNMNIETGICKYKYENLLQNGSNKTGYIIMLVLIWWVCKLGDIILEIIHKWQYYDVDEGGLE